MKRRKNHLKLTLSGLLLILFAFNVSAQSKSISGKVTDEEGMELPGVTIMVKGSTVGTITDIDGNYTITVASANEILDFTYVGMEKIEVKVGNRNRIDVAMKTSSYAVDEVVVVGYGTQRRSDITGAVATVKTDNLISKPSADLEGMLKGQVAGLYVTMGDARPGGSSNVILRGTRSLKGGNSPLYVVDGVALGSINEINVDDIESISVLKDAASQAIYGARASNGVILITTRRGSNTNDKVRISYNGYFSMQNVIKNFDVFSPEEYYQLRREAHRGDRANADNGWIGDYPEDEQIFTQLEMETYNNKNYVNWMDHAFKKDVPLTKHDVSLSGGNEKTQFSASLGYYYQDGIRMSSDLTRYTGKLTLDQKISDTFKTGLSVYYTSYNQGQETNNWRDFITFSPVAQIYDEQGELVRYPLGDGKSVNPLLYERTRDYQYNAERIIMNGYFDITPAFLPGFKYRLNASVNSRNRETESFRSFEDQASMDKGYARINFYRNRDFLIENIFTYNKQIKKHKFDVTLLNGIEPRYIYSTSATAEELGNDFFGINSMGSALESSVERSEQKRNMVSYMGRLNYLFNDKYLFNFTLRADGSSVFGKNNKWGYFPSAAVAWNLHEESFMKSTNWVNEAKVRLSYGQIGNQAIGPYGSLATANNKFYVMNGKPVVGYEPGFSLPNPNLKWETTTTLNVGIDFGLLDHRLTGSVEYYKSNTTDLLVDRQIPRVLGYSNLPTNLGEIQNAGVELSLTGFIVSTRDFNWSVTTNFSKNNNKLIKGVLQDPLTGEYIDDVNNGWFINEPVNNYYNYKFDGIWQIGDDIANSSQKTARPGDVRVADVSGPEGVPDGEITSDDRVLITRDPDWMGAISTKITYKGFELSADLNTVQGVTRNNLFLSDYDRGGRMDGILNGIKQDYWTPENPSNTVFRPHETSYSEYRGIVGYQDASYVRLRNVTVGYNFASKLIKPMGLSKLRVYVAGDNLVTWTDFKSFGPETNPDGYPETKNFTFGLNINF